jgi:nicotinate-nucleotide adenylyltransferase
MFGGTFDPPHYAHLHLARFAMKRLGLDCLYFIPAAIHALKKHSITPASWRYKMVQAAIGSVPDFFISRIEMERSDISYSIDTIRSFKKYEHLPAQAELFYILGLDNLNELHLWKDPEQIFKLAKVVVLDRPGFKHQPIIDRYPQVLLLASPLYDISATEIRKKIKSGESVKGLLPAKVWQVIKENNLYREQVLTSH